MERNTVHRKRYIHYGRVGTALLLLLIVAVLIYALVRMTSEMDNTPASLVIPETTQVHTIEYVTEATTEATTEAATEAATEATTEYIEPPESIQLEVPYISQKGLLPTGCELVSAMMVLQYYGADVTVEEIIDNTNSAYPKTQNGRTYGYHPEVAFIGSPWDETSFGCYSPVIVDMMNKLLPEGKIAKDVSGNDLQTLAEVYLPRNMPVLVWATISMLENYPNIGWYLYDEDGNPTDEWYDWQANEHCLVLVGYDSEYYYLNDPYGNRGLVKYDRELVETRYNSIGQYAVVVVDERPA